MKFKDGWRSVVPIHTRGESSSGFCVFPKVKSADHSPGTGGESGTGFCVYPKVKSPDHSSESFPVYLNVYDLTPINGYLYWAGVGVFHTGVEVHGVEYAFGAHEYPTSGVFEIDPKQCPGFRFRKSIFIGTTHLKRDQVREFMEHQSVNYNGNTYHLVVKNCNHFCEDMCYKLTGNRIPKWVNRLARIGSVCNFILPEALKTTKVRHDANCRDPDCERNSLRRSLSCFSSISMHHRNREVSMSSLFLHTHYKGDPIIVLHGIDEGEEEYLPEDDLLNYCRHKRVSALP
ncbi:PPPDE putative thiol peptidase family protein [Striga hermonthica]|uniref:PPPDE putative thiol peptidase family protein n=1 Tax=Striga hermonthica TaxID=68872 RepID=A0A9N7NF02_STRHE|nr:PPPDE putative thiol peptidase family protein [Striga hermonthica]